MKYQILNLGKDSLIYGVGSAITRFIGLFLLPVFTSYLSPQEYGVLAMLALLTMVVHPIFSLGLGAAIGPCYFEGGDGDTKSRAIWTAVIIHACAVSILLLTAILFPEPIGKLIRLPEMYYPLVVLSIVGCSLTILNTALSLRVQFEKQAKLYVSVTIATSVTTILVNILTVVFLGWGALGMVTGQVLGNIVTFCSFLFIALKATKPSFSFRMARELLRLGFPMVPSFAFLFIIMNSNKYILEWFWGLDSVGIYSVGFSLGAAITIVTNGFANSWFPFFMSYAEKQDEVNPLFGRILTYYTLGVGFLSLMFFVFAKPVILILANPTFSEAFRVVGLVSSSYFLLGVYSQFLVGIYFKREIGVQSVIQGAAAVLAVPVNFLLIKHFGILGAGIGVAMGHFFIPLFTHLWNIVRKNDYVVITYEWKRIGFFSVIYILTVITVSINPTESLSTNLFLSTIGCGILIFLTIQLLSPSELKLVPILNRLEIKSCAE